MTRAERPDPAFDAAAVARWPAGTRERFVRLGLLAEVAPASHAACTACAPTHVEEVQWVREPGAPARVCVACADYGLIWLDPAELRRWAVQLPALAAQTAMTLGAAGGVVERVPGRAWKLGAVRLGSRVWVSVLAVGLDRPDAAAVLDGVPEARAANALVLVPAALPIAALWPTGRAPPVVPLCDVLAPDADGLEIDRTALESALPVARHAAKGPIRVFPTPPGATWEGVALAVEEFHVRVRVGDVAGRFGFAEAGFEDRREGNAPDDVWALLRLLARFRGTLGTGDAVATKPGVLKQRVSVLRDRLRALLALDGDPFHPTRRGQPYRARFAVRAEGTATFPTPPGATWDDVTVTEVAPGVLEVTVTTAARGAEYVRGSDAESAGLWEGATTAAERTARHTLADLGLGEPDAPTAAGTAVLTLLRAGGRLTRPANDPELLALGAALSRFFQLPDPPLAFDAKRTHWFARFEAASFVPPSDR